METQTIAYDEKKEVINLEEDSSENSEDEYDNEDEDPVRADIYEDYDELADLAVTASEEPPPPGTRVSVWLKSIVSRQYYIGGVSTLTSLFVPLHQ